MTNGRRVGRKEESEDEHQEEDNKAIKQVELSRKARNWKITGLNNLATG
jgi:hypothetical protein